MAGHEHGGERAVVFYDKSAAEVPFRNFTAQGKKDTSIMTNEEVYGFLIVFNSFEEIIDPKKELNNDAKKIIEGLSSEISVAYIGGWKVIYYTSFKKFVKCGEEDLPREFTCSEDDSYYNKTTRKEMIEYIHSFLPYLQSVRFVGIISNKELERIESDLTKDKLKLEKDSPYLISVE